MTTRWLRVVLVVAFVAQGWYAIRDVRYDRAMHRGIEAYNGADVDAVRDGFRDARALADSDPYLWAWSGDAALYAFDYHSDGVEIDPALGRELLDEAWAAYAASVARSPAYAWSWTGLSGVATRRAKLESERGGLDLTRFSKLASGEWDPFRAIALVAGETARSLNPDGFLEMDVVAGVYASAGDRERAAELLVRSASIMPAPSFHPWGVGRRLDGGLYGAILDALQRGVATAPAFERSRLHVEVGRFARAQGDLGTALEEFEQAETAAGDGKFRLYQARWEQATVLQELGEFDRAIEATLGVIETGRAIEPSRRRLAGLYRMVERFEEACAEYRRGRPSGPEADAWWIAGAISCRRAGKDDEAVRMLETALVDPTRQTDLARALVDLLVDAGRKRTAKMLLDRWAEDHEDAAPRFREWSDAIDVRPVTAR